MRHFIFKFIGVLGIAVSLCSCGYGFRDSYSELTNSIDSGTSASAGLLYTCRFYNDDKTTLLWTGTVSAGEDITYGGTLPSKAKTAQYTYTFSGWDKSLKGIKSNTDFYATYTSTVNTYRVEFINYDDTVIVSSEVEYDTYATAPTTDPIRAKTDEYTYTFKGWDKDPSTTKIVGPTTFKAQYDESKNTYQVSFVVEGVTTHTVSVSYGEYASYSNEWDTPVKSNDNDYVYSFNGWDKPLATTAITKDTTFTAVFSKVTNSFKVTFKDGDGKEVQSSSYKYGETPTYTGDEPTKTATDEYSYTFKGWDQTISPVTGDVTYTATFDEVTNKYLVSFYDDDGTTLLYSKEFPYGTVPTYGGTKPSKASSNGKTYTFKSWDKDLVAVTGITSYKATYTATNIDYTITYKNGDTVLATKTYHYGETPSYDGTPTKDPTTEYGYVFDGWEPAFVDVVSDATYTAKFTTTTNKYTIKFVDEDGTELQSSSVFYGSLPEYTGETPTKTGNDEYSYTFNGWDNPIVTVKGDATYTVKFKQEKKKYTITFKNYDGTTLDTQEVEYGATPEYKGTPTKSADAQYSYLFAGWDNTPTAVTGAATYTATFSKSTNKYTIKFVDGNGKTLQTSQVDYGSTPSYTGDTPTKTADAQYTYTFSKWPTIASVTGDATYTAEFTSTTNQYTIKFVNENGDVLQTSTLVYGATPVYSGTTPSKDPTVQNTYTFAGWDHEIVDVTGNATYKATFSTAPTKYTITFKNENGTPLNTQQVEYGALPTYTGTPTQASDANYAYTFDKWDTAFVSVTGDATYTALYEKGTVSLTYTYDSDNGVYAVSGCTSNTVTDILIPQFYDDGTNGKHNVTSIANEALKDHTTIKTISIPSNITSISHTAFYGCTALLSINVASTNSAYTTVDGILFNKAKTTLCCYPAGKTGSYTVSNDVTSIAQGAFNSYASDKITIPFVGASATDTANNYFAYIFGGSSYSDNSSYVPSSLKTVVMTGGTTIAKNAFNSCSYIASITVTSTVTSIGDSAFQGCSSLTSITLPFVGSSATGTTNNLFGYIFGASSYSDDWWAVPPSLKTVVITGGTTIAANTFRSCSSLTSITVPSTVTSIGSSAFEDCNDLVSLTIPFLGASATDTTYNFLSYCFGANGYNNYNCVPTTLKTVVITGGNAISYNAFYNCSHITSISLPSSTSNLAGSSFNGCTNLAEINVDSANATYLSVNGVLFNHNKTTLIRYPQAKSGAYIIPDGVTSLDYCAFKDCTKLTSVTIPSSVTSVQGGTFSNCSAIESLTLPSYGNHLGNLFGAFNYEENSQYVPASLKTVTITGGTTIGKDAFYQCSSLTNINISSTITTIEKYAFYFCSSLLAINVDAANSNFSSVDGVLYNKNQSELLVCPMTKSGSFTIFDSVTSISRYAFNYCNKITSFVVHDVNSSYLALNGVIYSKDKTTIVCYPAGKSDKTYTIPDYVTSIAPFAFCDCCAFTNMVIPNTVTSMGQASFCACNSLASLSLPFTGEAATGTTSDNNFFGYIFGEDGQLNSIKNVPSSIKTVTITGVFAIPEYAFYNNDFTSLIISNNVTSIAFKAVDYCSRLQSITLPFVGASATDTTHNYFGYIFGLDSPGGNQTRIIPENLSSVTITGGTTIGDAAFYNLTMIKSIILPSTITSIGKKAFIGDTAITSISLPSNVASIGLQAFSDCTSLTAINVDTTNSHYVSVDGVLYNKDITTLVAYPGAKNGVNGVYTLPKTVTAIDDFAFYGCNLLTSFKVESGNTSFASVNDALYNYDISTLISYPVAKTDTTYVIPDTVTLIREGALYNCSKFVSLTIPFVGASATDTTNNYFGYIFGAYSSYSNPSYVPSSLKTVVITGGTTIADDAFYKCYSIASITIPNSVTYVGTNAFDGCSSLTYNTSENGSYLGNDSNQYLVLIKSNSTSIASFTINGNTKVIANNAFYNCSKLTSMVVHNGIVSIGRSAFENCSSLTSITLPFVGHTATGATNNYFGYIFGAFSNSYNSSYVPSSLTTVVITGGTTIAAHAFSDCSHITSITIPSSITSIGSYAFYDCSSLTSITIPFVGASATDTTNNYFGYIFGASSYGYNFNYVPSSLKTVVITGGTTIAKNAFYQCSHITSITIPSSVTSIGDYAFIDCSSLTSITIPSSVASIGDYAFIGCSSLTAINVDSDNANYSSIDGVLFNKDPTTLICCPGGKSGSYVVPSSVTSISDKAFYGCSSLTSINIPTSVTSIGSGAFRNCSSLTSITLPFVGASATDTTNNFFGYIFGADSYGSNSSYVPSLLTTVVITGGTTIAKNAFYQCSHITSITIPSSVTSIGKSAFESCTNLASITLPFIGESITSSNNYFTYVFGASSSTTLFFNLPQDLKTIVITGGTTVAHNAFYGLTTVTSITLPDNVTSIGSYAFDSCTALTSFTLPSELLTIGSHAFNSCIKLTSILIPKKVTSIGEQPFASCSALTTINVDSGNANYSSADGVLFNKDQTTLICFPLANKGLSNAYTIPSSVETIGDNAFYGCSVITTINIPKSVTSIGKFDFTSCSALTAINVDSDNANYSSTKGVLFNKDKTTLLVCPQAFNGTNGVYAIPNTVTKISSWAFSASILSSITIPTSVATIEGSAFSYCASLTSIFIPSTVTAMGQWAFYYCNSLTTFNCGATSKREGWNSAWYTTTAKVTVNWSQTAP